jgi:type IV pilus assembly protein PilM
MHSSVLPELFGMHGRLKKISQWLRLCLLEKRPILGIDITSTAVKILEISAVGDALCIENYGHALLSPKAMPSEDINAVANSIQKIVSQFDTPCRQVAIAVPDSEITSKIIPFYAQLSNSEIEELVIMDFEKYFSYPIEALNFDFEVLGPSKENPNRMDVLLVGARRAAINNRVAAVKRAGLDVLIVDVESYAVERAAQQLIRNFPANRIAIIEIGVAYMRLLVLHHTKLIYSREELLEGVAQGQLPTQDTLLLQIKRALHFFYSANQEGTIEYILLTGDLIRHQNLAALIQEELAVPSVLGNPFSSMALGNKALLDTIHYDAPSLMVACGLALRNIQ